MGNPLQELQVVGDFLNEEGTKECKTQTLSAENGEMKHFEFSALFFFSCFLPLLIPRFWPVWPGFATGHAEEQSHSPAVGNVFPAPFGPAAAPHQGLTACAPPALTRAALASCPPAWWVHTVEKPRAKQRRRKRVRIRGQPAIVSQEGVNPGAPDLVSYCLLLWVKAFLA